jgi:hypothetical protein
VTYRTSEDFAEETSPFRRFVRGMIRRVKVTLSEGSKWQVLGGKGGKGGPETFEAEPFTGVGFYSRPPASGGNPEAIAVAFGGNAAMAIVGTRDEATRQAVAGNLDDDETMTFNTSTIVYHRKNGTLEIRAPNGTAIALPTLADYNALRLAFNGHQHFVNTAGTAAAQSGTTAVPGSTVGPPTGTTVLKAQ